MLIEKKNIDLLITNMLLNI